MERDFMGLNSEDSVFVVKEEVVEGGCKDSGLARSLGLAWPLSNKVPALPHFLSFKCKRDQNPSQNFGGSTVNQQYCLGCPAQLTIFYAGTVNVFDGISPEKAQAIIFLAGNGCVEQSKVDVQAAASKVAGGERVLGNQSVPCSGLPSPMSVSSHPIDEFANNDDAKTIGCKVEPQRVVSVAATAMISSAIPQARKASLARFLEKRKERVMNAAAPYKLGKKVGDCATLSDSNGGFSATSSVSTSKEINGDI